MQKTKVLTKKLIDQILRKPIQLGHYRPDGAFHQVEPFDSFTEIEDDAAIYFSKKVKVEISLKLNDLTSLSDVAAAAFGRLDCDGCPGYSLVLAGLKNISDTGLKSLAKFQGSLSLGGLRELSNAGAKALASHKGAQLDLNGLTTLTELAAKNLSSYYKGKNSGDWLGLCGLSKVKDGILKELVKYKGHLLLSGFKTISDSAAKILAEHQGPRLHLDGLKTLSETAARALSAYKGVRPADKFLSKTRGTILLGENSARVLLKQKGGDVVLHRVK